MLYVKVDRIQANPWQTRQRQESEALQALVIDIESRRASRPATKGLLQVPAGRLVTGAGTAVDDRGYYSEEEAGTALTEGDLYLQLAYGHRRLAAFRELAENDHIWAHMPVELVWFTDEEMATAAWSENWERRDLTPMEQAEAIALMMEDFGWTQTQVAEKLGVDRSTVANKLRLLKLPVEQRIQVQEGTLTERQGLALLPLMELPEGVVEASSTWTQDDAKRVVEQAGTRSSDEIRNTVKRVVEAATEDLEHADFPLAFALEADGVRAATCEVCDYRRGQRCADKGCFQLRTMAWRRGVLAPIAEELGIPMLDPEAQANAGYSDIDFFYNEDDLQFARDQGCKNLRVAWRKSEYLPAVDGHEQAMLVCYHGRGTSCSCKHGKNREEEEARKEQEKAQKQAVKEAKAALVEQVVEALDEGQTAALRAVLVQMGGYSNRDKYRAIGERERIVELIAKIVVDGGLYWGALVASGKDPVEAGAAWLRGIWLADSEGLVQVDEGPTEAGEGLVQIDEGLVQVDEESPLADIQRRWERIQGWMQRPLIDREAEGTLTSEAIQGNIDNLDRLMEELGVVEASGNGVPVDVVQALRTTLEETAYTLEGML